MTIVAVVWLQCEVSDEENHQEWMTKEQTEENKEDCVVRKHW